MADQFDTGGDRRQATVQCPSLSHLWPLWEREERRGDREEGEEKGSLVRGGGAEQHRDSPGYLQALYCIMSSPHA